MKSLRFTPQGARRSQELKQSYRDRKARTELRAINRLSGPATREPLNHPAPKSYKGYVIKTVEQVVAEEKFLRKLYGPYQR